MLYALRLLVMVRLGSIFQRGFIVLRQTMDTKRTDAPELDANRDGFMTLKSVRDDSGAIIDFEWTFANEEAGEIMGRSGFDFVGRRMLEEFPWSRDKGWFDDYVRIVETGRVFFGRDPLSLRR